MKAQEIRDMTAVELTEKINELKSELFNLRFQHATNQLDNPMKRVHVKKDSARCKTSLRQKELNA